MRMGMRRFTRLTNALSKKIENHMHAISFYVMVYNFVKVQGSVKTTPAIAAGVTGIKWTMEDIVNMADTMASRRGAATDPGRYRSRAQTLQPVAPCRTPKCRRTAQDGRLW
jgi:hypothetical protein